MASSLNVGAQTIVTATKVDHDRSLHMVGYAEIQPKELALTPPCGGELFSKLRIGIIGIVLVYDIADKRVGRRRLYAKTTAMSDAA